MGGKTNKTGFRICGFKNVACGLLIFGLIFGSCVSACDHYCNSCDDCEAKITLASSGQTICLSQNITNHAATCINDPSGFSNKILDCQGHTIDGKDEFNTYGIYAENREDLTIKNCVLTDWMSGIRLYNSNSNTVINNTANSNRDYGIGMVYSDFNTIINNNFNSNDHGISLSSSSHNTITHNKADSNKHGIRLGFSDRNTITHNTADSNNYQGISLGHSSHNTITHNTADSNNWYGIELSHSNSNIFINNIANSNSQDGIRIWSSNSNTITNTTANFNREVGIRLSYYSNSNTIINNTVNFNNGQIPPGMGIYLSGSNSNTITHNTANSNNMYGIELFDSSHNTLTHNTANFNNMYGIELYDSSHNTLTHNTANFNSKDGIHLFKSSSSTISNNTANDNGDYGIYLYSNSNNNNLVNNNIINNNDGVYFSSDSNNNNLTSNVICENGLDVDDDDANSGDYNTCDTTQDYNDITNGNPCTRSCDAPSIEICNNGIDDDGDGLADCCDSADCSCPTGQVCNTTICACHAPPAVENLSLLIEKWTETPLIASGEKARYWVRVLNAGDAPVTNITIVDHPDSEFKNGQVVNVSGDCTNVISTESSDYGDDSTYTIVGNLNHGEKCRFMYESDTSPSTTDGTYANTAMIYSAPEINELAYVTVIGAGNCTDDNGTDDADDDNGSVQQNLSLLIEKWTDTPLIAPGEKARYWVRVFNAGDSPVTNITIIDQPGPGFKNGQVVNVSGDCTNVISAESSDYGDGSTYTIVGNLNHGEKCRFMYESDTSPSTTDGTYANTAMIYSAPEINDSAYVTVLCTGNCTNGTDNGGGAAQQNLNLHKYSSRDLVCYNDYVDYTIVINSNITFMYPLELKDYLPAGIEYVPGHSYVGDLKFEPAVTGSLENGYILVWNLSNIFWYFTPLESVEIKYRTRVKNINSFAINYAFLYYSNQLQCPSCTLEVHTSTAIGKSLDCNSQNYQDSFTLKLDKGWNLISIPMQPENNSINFVLAPIDGKYLDVAAWNGKWIYRSYAYGDWFGDLSEIEVGRGYWLNMKENANLTIEGTIVSNLDIPLKKGWNLVGMPALEPVPLPELNINYKDIATYENKWIYRSYAYGDWFGDLSELAAGNGYWVNVNEDGSLNF